MRIIQNMTIRSKVLAAFAMVLSITVTLGVFSIVRLGVVNNHAADIRDNWLVGTLNLGKISAASERFRQHQLQLLLSFDPNSKVDPLVVAAYRNALQSDLRDRDSAWAAYSATITPGAEQEAADGVVRDWSQYLTASDPFMAALNENRFAEAEAINTAAMHATFARVRSDLARDLALNAKGGSDAANEGQAVFLTSRIWIILVGALASLVSFGAGWGLIINVSSPIRRMTTAMASLAAHDLATEIEGIGRKDEIGQMANAVQVFKDSMIKADQLAEAQAAEQAVKERRAAALESLTRDFEAKIGLMVQTLSSASTEMEAAAQSMAMTAERTNQLSGSVVTASGQTSSNVQTVATATEELSASIQEIARQVAQSAYVSDRAVERTNTTNLTVQALTKSTQKIGNVVKLISSIAGQTNLLALNATIEAARAGEAGRGFAVVAGEVKNLAKQTANATVEIAEQIDQIQSATDHVVVAMKEISDIIIEINEIASAIASAVEEQGAATQEIARNIQQAAQGTQIVNDSIFEVKDASTETGAMATQVLGSAGELAQHSSDLRGEVDTFLYNVKAA